MKPETLERLVMDRHLGELAPDTEELLAAYLDGDVAAARSVEDVREVIATARRAVRHGALAEEQRPLPPPRFVTEASRSRRRRPLAAWTKPVAAAAVVGLAFWLGSLGARPTAGPRSVPLVSNDVYSVPRAADATHGGFWSLDELSRRSATRHEYRHRTVTWPGPVSRPRLGEQS